MQCLNDVRDFKYVYTLLVSMAQYTRRADTDRRNMLKCTYFRMEMNTYKK